VRALLLGTLALIACAPARKLEETTFAAALGVDLAASRKLESGMYVRDQEEGTGVVATNGRAITMRYTGWLADGTQFDSN
jgi:peptidylprolyl isomerase